MKKKEKRNLMDIHVKTIIILHVLVIAIIIVGIFVEQAELVTQAIITLVIVTIVGKICITIRKVCKSYLNEKNK